MSDLIERLRDLAADMEFATSLETEAADQLEAQQAEIERLQASHNELVKIAALVGEQDDPFAAWESLEGIVEAALEQRP